MSEHTVLEIDTEQELQKIIAQLDRLPDQIAAPNILRNAINSTARKVRTQLLKDAKARYAVSKASVWKDENEGAPKVFTASSKLPVATVRSRGPMQDIMNFLTHPNTATGAAAAKVLNDSGMTPLEKDGLKAFVTTFASGHTAIVQRLGKERLPVKKLLSPAVPHMLGNEEVRTKAEGIAYATLHKEIQKRIDKIKL